MLTALSVVAQIVQGVALCALGHPVAGTRALDPASSGHQPGAIQAWQRLAARFARGDHNLDRVGAVSALGLRAQLLGAGDGGIAQIAYDDSLRDHGVAGRSTVVDLIARALGPTTKCTFSREAADTAIVGPRRLWVLAGGLSRRPRRRRESYERRTDGTVATLVSRRTGRR